MPFLGQDVKYIFNILGSREAFQWFPNAGHENKDTWEYLFLHAQTMLTHYGDSDMVSY
jgi:hypothetical protein